MRMATSTLKGMGMATTTTFKMIMIAISSLKKREWLALFIKYSYTNHVYIKRLRVVPTSASYIREDGHLHLENDGDGHHHLEKNDDCHFQLEEMRRACHIWLCYLCVCSEIESCAHTHVLYR
jgi:hypothetical protein